MTRDVLNTDLNQIEWVRHHLHCSANEAVRLLLLYGYLEYITAQGNAVAFKQSVFSKKTGYTRDTIRKDLIRLAENGWASITSSSSGCDVELRRIPWGDEPVVMTTQSSVSDESVVSEVTSQSSVLKKDLKNSSNEEKKEAASTLKKDLVLKWNEWKPKSWLELKSISSSRDRSIRALGGYREVIDLIPAFMAGAKANKFWISKDISFENVIGTGTTPKGHFHELAERGSSSNLNTTPSTLSQPTEHSDFFPPIDPRIALRPKHANFANDEDRDRREAEAREFYQQQEAA